VTKPGPDPAHGALGEESIASGRPNTRNSAPNHDMGDLRRLRELTARNPRVTFVRMAIRSLAKRQWVVAVVLVACSGEVSDGAGSSTIGGAAGLGGSPSGGDVGQASGGSLSAGTSGFAVGGNAGSGTVPYGQTCTGDSDCASGVCFDFSLVDHYCGGKACSVACSDTAECVQAATTHNAPTPSGSVCGSTGICSIVGTGLGSFWCQ
jgi:hypothetical protein